MRICLIILIMLVVSCAPIGWNTPLIKMSFEIGKEKKVNVGNSMILVENCNDIHEERWAGLVGGGYIKRDYRECDAKQELIYNGISKNTVRVTYREYYRDMARPAFFQDLNYDLDQSNVVQFRSTKIQIIEANNLFIKFIVLEGPLPKENWKVEIIKE